MLKTIAHEDTIQNMYVHKVRLGSVKPFTFSFSNFDTRFVKLLYPVVISTYSGKHERHTTNIQDDLTLRHQKDQYSVSRRLRTHGRHA